MLIPFLILFAAILFIVGVLLIIRGAGGEEVTVVPISNPKEIAEFKKAFAPVQLSASNSGPTVVQNGEKKSKSGTVAKVDADFLAAENNRLIQEIQQLKTERGQFDRDFESCKLDHGRVAAAKDDQILKLEKEIEVLRQASHPALESTVDSLKSQVDTLSNQYEESQKTQNEVRESCVRLQEEKERLNDEVQKWQRHATELQENLTSLHADATKIKGLEETIAVLRSEKQRISISEFEGLNHKLTGSVSLIETLKRENKGLQEKIAAMENSVKDSGDLSVQLVEKDRLMQYELTKNRAQILGLEKICEDFKRHIEELTAETVKET